MRVDNWAAVMAEWMAVCWDVLTADKMAAQTVTRSVDEMVDRMAGHWEL